MTTKSIMLFSALGLFFTLYGETQIVASESPVKAVPKNHFKTESLQTEHSGVVNETMVSGGYIYAQVDKGGELIWLAGPPPAFKVNINQKIGWNGGMPMKNFSSPTLRRTFEDIYFISEFFSLEKLVTKQGKVEETIESGGYLYIKVNSDSQTLWLAAPITEIIVGDIVLWEGGDVMSDFESKTLERSFEEIIFLEKITKI